MNTTINIFQEIKDKLDIVDVINEVSPLDNQLKAKCPFHNDIEPSFSVNKEGQYFKCFGCGVTGDIFDFYEKYFKITKGEALKKLASKAGIQLDNNKPEVVATYEYKDENGNFLYAIDKVKVNGKKKFLGWRLENGKKVYNLNGVKRILYRLPELIKGPDPILIVEGEKDVETARSLDFTATTNPHGAGKWQNEYSGYLKDRDCILIPDNDEPGKEHMEEVKESLFRNGIKSVKIVNLPGLKEKQDFTDYINNGGSKEEFLKLINGTPAENRQPKEEISDKKQGISLYEIIEEELKPIHPALDFVDDKCFVTVPVMTRSIENVKKGKQIEDSIGFKYWVITSQKEIFPLTKEELQGRGYYYAGKCYILENRWNRQRSMKPWLEGNVTVDPILLFNKIRQQFEHYLDLMDKRLYSYFGLWTVGTYFYPLFPAYPILFLNGGSGSGKTKTITIISALAFNAVNTVNISSAAMFRVVQGSRGTQLLDENEKISDPENAAETINLILAGFLKGSKVIRLEKSKFEEHVPTQFEIHCPKAIANIKGINIDALLNRTVAIQMHPARKDDPRHKPYPDPNDTHWQDLRDDLYIHLMNHWKEIKEARKLISPKIDENYTLDNYFFMQWEPILTLAKYISDKTGDDLVYCNMAALAVEKMEERKKDKTETYENVLLRTILKMHNEPNIYAERTMDGKVFLSNERIIALYKGELESEPEWLTPHKLGWMLKKLHIGESARIHSNKTRGIWIMTNVLNEICQRHNIALEIYEN